MLEAVITPGMDGLETAISILLNEAMKVERSRALGAEPWQRSKQRRLGYANGYKPQSLIQPRQGIFYNLISMTKKYTETHTTFTAMTGAGR
jgi:hypothetical protein